MELNILKLVTINDPDSNKIVIAHQIIRNIKEVVIKKKKSVSDFP